MTQGVQEWITAFYSRIQSFYPSLIDGQKDCFQLITITTILHLCVCLFVCGYKYEYFSSICLWKWTCLAKGWAHLQFSFTAKSAFRTLYQFTFVPTASECLFPYIFISAGFLPIWCKKKHFKKSSPSLLLKLNIFSDVYLPWTFPFLWIAYLQPLSTFQ